MPFTFPSESAFPFVGIRTVTRHDRLLVADPIERRRLLATSNTLRYSDKDGPSSRKPVYGPRQSCGLSMKA
jgi:hypothetical protein